MVAQIDEAEARRVIRQVLQVPNNVRRSEEAWDTTHRSFFGCSASVIARLWNLVSPNIDLSDSSEYKTAEPKHLLYGLVFLKIYAPNEDVHCRIVGWVDRKTFRKWSWYFVELMHNLEYDTIKLDNRFVGYQPGVSCLMSVDGVHCPINEPWPFESRWYSEKLNGPGVVYEIGVCISTGWIVWVNGPFEASKNDSTIFIETLGNILAEDEGIECDQGYKGDHRMKQNGVNNSRQDRRQKGIVRSRHEVMNSRLKQFNVLNVPFHHISKSEIDNAEDMMEKHCICFKAVAVITQLKVEAGEKIFDVEYNINYD